MGQAQHGTEPTLVVLVNYILPPATKGLILAAPDLPGALNMTERGGSGMHLVATKENLKLWGERKHVRAAARRYSHHQVGSFMHCSSTADTPRCPPVASQGSHQQRNTSTSSRHTALATARSI